MSRHTPDPMRAILTSGSLVRQLRSLKYPLTERIWLYRQYWNPLPAILVHQMGKVGSRTVYRTLMGLGLPNPIYHVHWLSSTGIQAEKERYRQAGAKTDRHLRESRSLRRQLDHQREREWWIITLVRDPIARQISELFEQLWLYYPALMAAGGDVRVDQTLTALEASFTKYDETTDKCHTWFESELKGVFGIDIFDHPFDHEAGHSMVDRGQVRLLVLRLEDLDRNADLIGRFVGHPGPVTLINANVAENKRYAEAYKTVTANFRLPASLCQTIYGSAYARHFYGPAMRAAFVRRWAHGEDAG